MTPTPQEHASLEADVLPADRKRVVISGMSGLYPASHHVQEFSDVLYNKVNPISSNVRWKYTHPEVSSYVGNVPNLDRFDAQFFKVHYRLGNSMDSMSRKILEHTYQAIFDAGYSPEVLCTKKVGVFVGTCTSESEKASFYLASARTGFGILGCSKTMYANRISYWLNLKGPSMSIDEVCCSSTAALEQAYLAISRGDCDAAIVGGSSLCLHPQSSVHNGRIITMCHDGKTKSFDENADGCIKSEAIVVLLLQKAGDSLREYAELVHVKSRLASSAIPECVTGAQYGFVRNQLAYEKFLNSFYAEVNVSPKDVEYVEAFGAAVPEADKCELDTITKVFCEDRADPLLVGCVMSNVGYTEAATGVVALTKVLLSYHHGQIAANMNFTSPRKDVEALQDGRMRVVSDHQPFARTYTAISNLSLSGCTAHILLHGHYKPKDLSKYQCSIPRLVVISGRHEMAAKKILEDLKSRPIDAEELALLHNVHTKPIAGHLGKAFTILDTNAENKTVSLAEACEYFNNAQRPLWFVYSGMGSQWAGMGAQLMRIPIFAAAIEKCHKILEPKGLDLLHIITAPDKTIFDNILNSFVGIAAVQIGLTDVLRELGIVPDKIIGHSVGELGCAYADGCFTAEEMILAAYSRGLVSVETPFIRGSMAAVGIGYEQVKELIPPEIEVACHNAAESSTISGPADVMREFVASLSAKGIFAKEVPCSNIAYHSRYIAEAGPGLLKYLSEVIKDPKPRSDRWVSTSVPMDRWDEPSAKYSSAEYHTNNLLNPVLFEETSKLIPQDAVLVEIAPHGLLQAILKRSLAVSCKHIPLTRRGHPDNALFLLEAIGKLFMEGYNPQVAVLYPKVQFPVSTGTPMLSHLVEWEHAEKWNLPVHMPASRQMTAIWEPIVSVHDDESKFLRGHVIRGKNVYPFASCLVAAWDTLAMSVSEPKRKASVKFSDLHLFVQPTLEEQKQLRLIVSLHRGTGRFEILHGSSKVATGYVEIIKEKEVTDAELIQADEDLPLTSEDVYQMLYEREYSYSGDFRSIQSASTDLTKARIQWSNNWVTMIDGVIQLNALKQNHDGVSQPRRIRSLVINVNEHQLIADSSKDGAVELTVDDVNCETKCGGISMRHIKFNNIAVSTANKVSLNELKFVPHFNSKLNAKAVLQVFLQIVAQNANKDVIKVIEIQNYSQEKNIFHQLGDIVDTIPGLKVNLKQLQKDQIKQGDATFSGVDLVLVQNLGMDDKIFEYLYNILPRNTYLALAEETSLSTLGKKPTGLFQVVSSYNTGDLSIHLSRWRPNATPASITAFTVRSPEDFALLSTTRDNLPSNHKLLVLTSYPPVDGVKELVAKWRKEAVNNQVHLLMINYNTASDQDLDLAPELDLAFNVLNDSIWGGEYYLPLIEKKANLSNLTLKCEQIGDLNSLRWVQAPQPDESAKGLTVDVHYAGLNTLEAKRATGEYIKEEDNGSGCSFGMDFSGVTTSGTRVMGVIPTGACSSRIKTHPHLIWPVPSHWTMEDAATVPLPYAHAFYCLMIRTTMPLPGKSILVHGGAGALGQAAISICLAAGLRVFATVSDQRKKHFLRKLFPDLKEDHIGCSRDHTFGDMVRIRTNGKGVDRVLNCVPGDLKNVSLNCLGGFGLVIDTVQIPSNDDFTYGMSHMLCEGNYLTTDFSSVFNVENELDQRKLQLLVSDGISRGYVRPLSRVSLPALEAARALRLLQASRHRGRALLYLAQQQPHDHHNIIYSAQKHQLIVSDSPVLGLQLADRLVSNGARTLALLLPKVPTQALRKQISWKNQNAEVAITTGDLRDAKNVKPLVDKFGNGSVEGIYVISSKKSEVTVIPEVVRELDVFARKQAKSLKYFAVVSDDESLGNEICYSRAKDGLPATKLCLPSIKQVSDSLCSNVNALNWRQTLDGLEQALCSDQPVLFVSSSEGPRRSLVEKIAAITGVEISEDAAATTTLEELGLKQENMVSVKLLLRDEYNICLTEENIYSLTVEKIREIDQSETILKEVKGLEVFYNHVDTDELMATVDMLFLPTLTSKNNDEFDVNQKYICMVPGLEGTFERFRELSERLKLPALVLQAGLDNPHATVRETARQMAQNNDEFDVNQKYICMVPGLEGTFERFRELSERLKLPALVLQAGLDNPHATVRETARQMAQTLLKKARLHDHFYLLGYESGVMVALELAAILEERGFTGTVFCIGSSPEEFQATLEDELKEYTSEAALQEAVIRHMFTLMTGGTCDIEFSDNSTWREKVDQCVRSMRMTFSSQYVRAHFEAAYGKIVQVREYKPKPRPLRSNIVLLRAASNRPITSNDSMQQYSEQPITAYDLQLPLAHALKDLSCASIVNRHLHPDILNEFEATNICETFTIKSVMFATPEELGVTIE